MICCRTLSSLRLIRPLSRTLQTALVTGGTQGIGFEVAKALAVSRARVLLLSCKTENGVTAVQKIKEETSGGCDIEFIEIDLGSLSNVREIADMIREKEDRPDVVRTLSTNCLNSHRMSMPPV